MIIQTEKPKTIKHAHLTQQDRTFIQEGLEKGSAIKKIAEKFEKNQSDR